MSNKKIKISLVLNIIIFILTVISSIIMFTGFKFMHGHDLELTSTKLGMFRFFTVDSNMLMGLISLIYAYFLIKNKGNISKKMYLLKLMATTSVGLTFFVVFTYLGPISKYGYQSMLMNSNLFFHLIIPVLSMITFVCFEKTNKLKFKDVLYGTIPMLLYSIFYMSNVFIHMENGKVSPTYDWYWFVQNGVWTAIIVVPLIFLVTYLISLILWKLNKEKNND